MWDRSHVALQLWGRSPIFSSQRSHAALQLWGRSVGGLMEHLLILAEGDRSTAVLEHPLDHGQCPTSVHNRKAYQAILIPKQ
ncbi:MAG: hypothetical protein WBA57_14965 [Elainellaceae cyanobacterium]